MADGTWRRSKRPDAARLARPAKVKFVSRDKRGSLLRDPFDLRTEVGRAYIGRMNELTTHLGGDVSVPQRRLVDQAARLSILVDSVWNTLRVVGPIKGGTESAAFTAFLRAAMNEREVLRLLGLERRAKPVPTLQEYLAAKADG